MIELAAAGYCVRFSLGSESEPNLGGMFAGDTRLLQGYRWGDANGSSHQSFRQYTRTASWTVIPNTGRNEPAPWVAVHEMSLSSHGLLETVRLHSLVGRSCHVKLHLSLIVDMTDQFALRLDNSRFPPYSQTLSVEEAPNVTTVTVRADRAGFPPWTRSCRIEHVGGSTKVQAAEQAVTVDITWDIWLGAFETTALVVSVADPEKPALTLPPTKSNAAGTALLKSVMVSSPSDGSPIVAAGAPWFLTLFGRDSLWSGFLARRAFPWLLDNVVRTLGAFQGTVDDETRQEQPGKIIHELRSGAFGALDLVPYARYYGGVDTTPLWLMMLNRCKRETQVSLHNQALAAVEWMLGAGGIRETGYIRYSSHAAGLIHQGWKDSHDAILTDDGLPATEGVALVEVQGYAYDALRGAAKLATQIWDEPALARQLGKEAEALRSRFREDFLGDDGLPAMAVLGDGSVVRAIGSNIGHLLVTGIVDAEDAARITDRLLRSDMFTGYGIRTLSTTAPAYSPASYHRGSVWPHDTAIAMEGMASWGLESAAEQLADGILQLAEHLGGRIPEYILGLPSSQLGPTVPAQSAYPQAWAAAAQIAASYHASRKK